MEGTLLLLSLEIRFESNFEVECLLVNDNVFRIRVH